MKNMNINQLVTLAKAGNHNATMELWDRCSNIVENSHENGKVGTKHSRYTRSKYAQSFRQASGELYLVFLKCINDYDASRGASFNTYLNFKVKMYALDHLRTNRKKVTVNGEKTDVNFISYEGLQERLDRNQDGLADDEENINGDFYSSLDLDKTDDNEHSDNNTNQPEIISEEDAELDNIAMDLSTTHLTGTYRMGRHDLPKEKVNEILGIFPVGSRKREVLMTFLGMARHNGETPTVRELGAMLGVTGAMACHYMAEIRKDLAKAGINLR